MKARDTSKDRQNEISQNRGLGNISFQVFHFRDKETEAQEVK